MRRCCVAVPMAPGWPAIWPARASNWLRASRTRSMASPPHEPPCPDRRAGHRRPAPGRWRRSGALRVGRRGPIRAHTAALNQLHGLIASANPRRGRVGGCSGWCGYAPAPGRGRTASTGRSRSGRRPRTCRRQPARFGGQAAPPSILTDLGRHLVRNASSPRTPTDHWPATTP